MFKMLLKNKKTLHLLFLLFSISSLAAFEEKVIRFPAPNNIISIFRKFYPDGIIYSYNCNQITEENMNLIGVNSVVDGKPTSPNPGASFQSWYMNCLVDLNYNTEAALSNIKYSENIATDKKYEQFEVKLKELLLETAFNLEKAKLVPEILKIAPNPNIGYYKNVIWLKLDETTQKQIIQEHVHSILGSEEGYEYLGFNRSEADIVNLIFESVNKTLSNSPAEIPQVTSQYKLNLHQKSTLVDIVKLIKILTMNMGEFLYE